MKNHRQKVSFGVQALWYDVMSFKSMCSLELVVFANIFCCRGQLKCDFTRVETRFRLSAKRTSPLKSAGASVQSTTDSRGLRISGSNAGYTMFRGSVKGTGYPIHSPVSPSLPLPCVTVFRHVSTVLYHNITPQCLYCTTDFLMMDLNGPKHVEELLQN